MTPTTFAIVIAVAIVVVVLVLIGRARRSRDGVDSFRRQIDALSPEARRPVVDQVQNAASRIEPRPAESDTADPDTAADADTDDGADPSSSEAAGGEASGDVSDDIDDPDGGSHGT